MLFLRFGDYQNFAIDIDGNLCYFHIEETVLNEKRGGLASVQVLVWRLQKTRASERLKCESQSRLLERQPHYVSHPLCKWKRIEQGFIMSRSFENLVYWARKAAALDTETEEGESKYYLMAKKSGLGMRQLGYYSNAYEAAGESGIRALSYRKKMPENIRENAEKKVKQYISEKIPAKFQSKVRLAMRVRGNAITVFEERPLRTDPSAWSSMPIFQVRYIDYDDRWHLYWMRVFNKWWPYTPKAAVYTIDDCIGEVEEDIWGCFWG